jgi:hypothetical protein
MSMLLAGLLLAGSAPGQEDGPGSAPSTQSADVRDIFLYTNQQRAFENLPPLAWSDTLAAAARLHAQRMAAAATLSHRYANEPELGARAAAAGARFTSIAENIGAGSYARQIDEAWMRSMPHRSNILDARMNTIGIAVVAAGPTLYAVEDFAVVTPQLSVEAVEQKVLSELQSTAPAGSLVLDRSHTAEARCLCESNSAVATWPAAFSATWQGADLALPRRLAEAVRAGKFHHAVVGACPAVERAFSVYRVHVSLD